MRPRFKAALATAAAAALPLAGIAFAPAVPAGAVTCPSGSKTFNTENDAAGNHIQQLADNFGASGNTCFSTTGSNGQMTLTQTDQTNNGTVTSYPDDGYGCSSSFCTSGWTSALWSSTTMTLTGTMSDTGVQTGSRYDLLADALFYSGTGTGQAIEAEVGIFGGAWPSYSNLGFCVSTSCGATSVTVNGVTWWLSENTSKGWPFYLFVRGTVGHSFSAIPLKTFFTDANNKDGGLGSLLFGYLGFGTELYHLGEGIQLTTVSAANVP